ncbi:acyloxyacyl hydrolase [Brachionus plicatilis]|uniref:Acyloxyacyl hydrolase n=1 Tax=Brachionus plicatilis TaxID=10195 RepID=A0A3M7QIM9_BRAPC|nr:acyloxyacyl hydrolase [Brachionus plicatilis]
MKAFTVFLSLVVLSQVKVIELKPFESLRTLKGANGGVNCAVCSVLLTMVDELVVVYNDTIEESLNKFCSYLPDGVFRITCQQAIKTFGPVIINGLFNKETPDVICHATGFCRTDPGHEECHIFPLPSTSIKNRVIYFKNGLARNNIEIPDAKNNPCNMSIFKPICDYIKKIFDKHEPAIDIDQDGHGTFQTLRGTSWRGKDCDDFSKKIHPGAIPINGDHTSDSNCNGIFGKDSASNRTYEEIFCKNSKPMGFGVLGDSISAHFSIPEQWLDAYQINTAVFEHLTFILENELDWPQLSGMTGIALKENTRYMNSTWPVVKGFTDSIYLKLLERNRCNFRDYQNIGVNGADTNEMKEIVKSFSRNQQTDQPVLLFLSLVGNDVCNGNPDTLNHMTRPDVFYKNVIEILSYLDTVLPNGSHVMLTGLANGSVLYDSLKDRVYPLGRVKNNIYYGDMYTYLSCLEISPCNGWMTTNDTLRRLTTEYAMILSVFEIWESMGGKRWQVIEAIDGFHLNQIGNYFMADIYWQILLKEHPDWISAENSYNYDIKKIFGDQAMKIFIFSVFLVSLFYGHSALISESIKGVNGGTDCAYCTLLVTIVEKLAIVYNDTIENSLNNLCQFLPDGIFRFTCQQAVSFYGPIIIDGIYSKENGDVICHLIGFCSTEPGRQECHLLPNKKYSINKRVYNLKNKLEKRNIGIPLKLKKGICDQQIFKELCEFLNKAFKNHEPAIDIDQDGHSTIPGRAPGSNLTYEEIFCQGSNQLGVAALGDSISAHFSVPEQWIDPYKINAAVFEHLAFIIENELDWPHLSAITGFMNSSWPVEYDTTNSIYLKMLDRNRCIFRDYQNVAVNGASTRSIQDIAKTLNRNQKQDFPVLLFLALVGNDVCNGKPDTLDHMTKPDDYYKNLIGVLTYLDGVLPNGSHVMLTGLANGSLLYESLKNTVYPLGRVRSDIYYVDFYNYLTCLQASPCNGWMTTNDTLRKLTTDYAMMLSKIAKNISETKKFNNFDLAYTDVPFDEMMEKWESMGGEKWQLIEPFDGFHINQLGNVILADLYWDILVKEHFDWLGTVIKIFLLINSTYGKTEKSGIKNFKDVNGGTNCAVCTVLVTLVEQIAIVYNDTIEETLFNFCNFIPEGLFRITCQQAVETFGPIIIDGIYAKENGDVICHAMNFCRTDPGQPECHILPKKRSIEESSYFLKRNLKLINKKIPKIENSICDIAIFKEICDYIKRIFDSHEPAIDIDQDGHSTIPKIIKGRAPGSNLTYEEIFCQGSNQLGVAVLGDSISAHFSIPEQWLDANQINAAVFEHLAFIIENELDWPHLSAMTGFMNSTWPVVLSHTNSIYLKLLAKNRCNFRLPKCSRARTGSMRDIAKSLARNQDEDQPLLLTLSLVGNDVCNGHPDTLDHMTKPKEFRDNLLYVLDYLDNVIPQGSHVILTGLANGSVLYDVLGERVYPLGRVRNDIKYKDVYTYLSNGWMTTNATLRKLTTDYAMNLSRIVEDIASSRTYKHFDMAYTDVPIEEMMAVWESMGGQRWQLIEPVDGFHINQNGNIILADLYWKKLNTYHSTWLGPENKFNNDINKIFGDQGGY